MQIKCNSCKCYMDDTNKLCVNCGQLTVKTKPLKQKYEVISGSTKTIKQVEVINYVKVKV